MPTPLSSDDRTPATPTTALAHVADSDASSTFSAYDDDDGFEAESTHRRRLIRQKQAIRIISLVFATLSSLCAGSIVVFSLYAPQFQSRLRYTQFQVNGVSIAGSLALYLPISVMGYVCDRVGVTPLSLLSAVLFGTGYGTAAFIYRKLDIEYNVLKKPHGVGNEWSYPAMIFAFVCIGSGTCAMYIASLSTCAKNFGKGKYRGLALAMPITGFGLSGMWLSQFGSRILYETKPDGSRGDIDVFRFFIFLAVLLAVMGIIGTFLLRVVDEQDLIEEAIEELETSGLLDGSSLLSRSQRGYGAAGPPPTDDGAYENSALLDSSKDDDAQWKKNWVLNAETRQFLADHTMWLFALAFFLTVGPGEAFINNLGTVIGTLTPPSVVGFGETTSAATHVSVFGITSTIARLLIGTLTDLLAPSPETQHIQISSSYHSIHQSQRFALSRIAFMLFFAVLMSLGFIFLASGAAQNHADRFWVVSGLVGAGYGAMFSLTPLIVTIIWGVENFATNFGIIAMLPAVGSTFWGLVYSAVYQAGAKVSAVSGDGSGDDDLFCYGKRCYSSTFWAEGICVWVACVSVLYAWKGNGGWKQRGIVI